MTEDDTFNALVKLPFEVIVIMYEDWWNSQPVAPMMSEKEVFLASHNWTFDELFAERRNRQDKRLHPYA